MNQFYKGRTNNHLTWVMVDATDFATPESALSAAMKIKIWGKLRAAAGVNFVSSGTGSLTNDITHAGPSVLGIYSIGLAKADLSDASAAWYDQYIISLSATGAAYQTLIVDGGIDASALLVGASNASEAQSHATLAASRILLVQSRLSDFMSDIFPSAISDLRSGLKSYISDVHSDIRSYLVVMSGVLSDVYSGVSNINSATAVSPDLSDIASAVLAEFSDTISNLLSAIAATNPTASDIASVVWTNTPGTAAASRILQIRNQVSDLQSDFQSRVPKAVATNSQLSDLHSDLKSHLAVSSGVQSDIYSLLSDLHSDVGVMSGVVSDISSGVNIARVNNVVVQGTGILGDKWRPV